MSRFLPPMREASSWRAPRRASAPWGSRPKANFPGGGASRPALDLLGYQHEGELLGRRVIVVVPARFHQAHIAGTTLHATNGPDNLLGVPINVPMLGSDGTEVPVRIQVRSKRLDVDHRVFVARFRLPEQDDVEEEPAGIRSAGRCRWSRARSQARP